MKPYSHISFPEGWQLRLGPLFVCSTRDGHAWFRLFGWGLWWRDLRRIDEQFIPLTERHGLKQHHEVGWVRWGTLKPTRRKGKR